MTILKFKTCITEKDMLYFKFDRKKFLEEKFGTVGTISKFVFKDG